MFLGRPRAAEGNLQLVLTSFWKLEFAPSDLAVKPAGISVAWTAAGGARRASDGFFSVRSFNLGAVDKVIRAGMPELAHAVPDPETEHWINVEWPLISKERGGHFIPPGSRNPELTLDVGFNLRHTDAERLLAPDASPTETAEFVTAKPEMIWRNPLAESERRTYRAVGVRVARAETTTSADGLKAVDLAVVETSSSRLAALTAHLLGYGPSALFSPRYYTANRSLGAITGVGRDSAITVEVAGVQVTWRKFSVREPMVRRDNRWVSWRTDWDRSMMLFLIGFREEGHFTRTAEVSEIKTGPSANKPFYN
jgi:hypothetical protein